jgi:hypothetical protein
VAQIIDAVDEAVDVTNCQGKGNCHHGETCLTPFVGGLIRPDTRFSEPDQPRRSHGTAPARTDHFSTGGRPIANVVLRMTYSGWFSRAILYRK